jgi:ribose transport system ATP-binding protein
MTVRENLTLADVGGYSSAGRLRRRKERADARRWMERFDVRPCRPEAPLWTLSGGNQQKVILARWLKTDPDVLLLDEPTQGVDVGAKEQIYRLVREAAAGGVTVLVCSSDAEELERLCDRVLVLRDGRVARELAGTEVSTTAIDHAALSFAATEETQ